MELSVIVPAYNARTVLGVCLQSILDGDRRAAQVIVVDDGSTDDTAGIARSFGVSVLRIETNAGPAVARNLGAEAATGELLLFLDADVAVGKSTLGQVAAAFEGDPSITAVIGSYDQDPSDPGFLSKYRNLMHSYFHQHGRREAHTFWGACGAIRRDAFFKVGGFNAAFSRPSIEDIELGYRLKRGGARIVLDPAIHVKHLKTWKLREMVETDIRDRGIPWTQLILRDGLMPNDLNIAHAQKASVALAGLGVAMTIGDVLIGAGCWALVLALNWRFYRFLAMHWGWGQAAAAIPLHLVYFLYSGLAFGIGITAYYIGPKPLWLAAK